MSPLELATVNLTTPAVLAFVLGVVSVLVGSDLRLPKSVSTLLTTYLLLAIGLKGGFALAESSWSALAGPAVATVALGMTIPVAAFAVLNRRGRFSVTDAAAIAAHYGSVSVVTFTAALAFVAAVGFEAEGFLPALVAILEVPGIVVALLLAQRATHQTNLRAAVHEVLVGRSIVLLVGGLVVGLVAGTDARAAVAPFFIDPFAGVLVLFLLGLGITTGEHLDDLRKAGRYLIGFALAAPVVFGAAGVAAGTAAGLSVGGAAVFGAMAASASYIAAPAAVQVALPSANPAYYLTASLAVTFPFNLVVGIPLYLELARLIG